MSEQTVKSRQGSIKDRVVRLKEVAVTRSTIAILKPFNRHQMVDMEHVRIDPENPLVFLGNHAEIYGPIASALCFPYPVRFWVISKMMFTGWCCFSANKWLATSTMRSSPNWA